MFIHKILNNNVVVILGENGLEQIVMGKGIAYKKRVGDDLDPSSVDKTFSLSNVDTNNKLQELLVDIPVQYMQITDDIVTNSKLKLGKKINDTIYVSLVDHIYTAVERYKEGIHVKNILSWEIRRFYKEEYQIGLEALDIIENKTGIRLTEDEAGFIALHLSNAQFDSDRNQDTFQITEIMQELTNIVKYEFNVSFDEDSVYFYRFITHLKFFAQRLVVGNTYEGGGEGDLYEIIVMKYPNSYNCVLKISDFIYRKYFYKVSDEEKMYLTIHIERIIYKNKN